MHKICPFQIVESTIFSIHLTNGMWIYEIHFNFSLGNMPALYKSPWETDAGRGISETFILLHINGMPAFGLGRIHE